ncbi:MAG TPA: universal stress protein, partial [Ilumatobacteraceae bacterium]
DVVDRLLADSPSLKLDPRVIDGPARKVLRDESLHSDLLVVGREGANRALPWLVGSTARSLSRHSHCPIAVVPVTWIESPACRVVVGIEHGAGSTATLRFAADLAAACGATMVVVGEAPTHAAALARSYFGGAVESIADGTDLIGALIGAAQDNDVIVLGTRHHGRFAASLFGADIDPIVERTVVPVVIVPEMNR